MGQNIAESASLQQQMKSRGWIRPPRNTEWEIRPTRTQAYLKGARKRATRTSFEEKPLEQPKREKKQGRKGSAVNCFTVVTDQTR